MRRMLISVSRISAIVRSRYRNFATVRRIQRGNDAIKNHQRSSFSEKLNLRICARTTVVNVTFGIAPDRFATPSAIRELPAGSLSRRRDQL